MILFSIRGKKYFGRVCKGWSEANIYVNVMYRFFKRRWDKGRYESDISMYSEFITDFFATLIHESLHILVKREILPNGVIIYHFPEYYEIPLYL